MDQSLKTHLLTTDQNIVTPMQFFFVSCHPLGLRSQKFTRQLKSITSIGPCLVSIKNLSLRLGQVSRCVKHAFVQRLLKKSNLDAT